MMPLKLSLVLMTSYSSLFICLVVKGVLFDFVIQCLVKCCPLIHLSLNLSKVKG